VAARGHRDVETTPQSKVDAARDMRADVVLVGDSYADAQACDTLVAGTGMTCIHPCRRSAGDRRARQFEFPERPGALMEFLDKLGGRWNISLFHCRNHGADFGRVLAGFEVPDADMAASMRRTRRPH
jgi:hypothetical protein